MPYLNFAVRRRRRWTMMWTLHAGWTYRNIDQAQLSELAARLAVVGRPSDPDAQRVYNVVIPLVLARSRLVYRSGDETVYRSFRQNVNLLPTNPKKLKRLAYLGEEVVDAWGSLERVSVSVQNFIDSAVLCPCREAAKAHLARCQNDPTFENKKPWAVLTPGAVKNTASTHRGPFCEDVDFEDHAAQVRERLKTIR